jgi:hypothetical protein
MDRLEQYRSWIRQLLNEYASYKSSYDQDVESEVITDTEHDHYQLMRVGWHQKRRIHGCVMHIDIRHGKVWIQHNGTDCRIAEELVAMGIPRNEIVLGFQPPYMRQYTEYAAA